MRILDAAIVLVLVACSARADSPTPANPCGLAPSDWCRSPTGDPCGAHRDEASCRADPQCIGMPYHGESVVACLPDGKGFWTNCPAVGCISQRPAESAQPPRH